MLRSEEYVGGAKSSGVRTGLLRQEAQFGIIPDVVGVSLVAPVAVRVVNPIASLAELTELEADETQNGDEEANLGTHLPTG